MCALNAMLLAYSQTNEVKSNGFQCKNEGSQTEYTEDNKKYQLKSFLKIFFVIKSFNGKG